METERPHCSVGKPIGDLNALVICEHRSSMLLTRSMLLLAGAKTVAAFENPIPALNHMISSSVDLVMIDAGCQPISGLKFIMVMRHRSAEPLCFIPSIIVSTQPTPGYVSKAMKTGAHLVLHRPFSTTMLRDRVLWLLNDKRKMYPEGDYWKIEGVNKALKNSQQTRLMPVAQALIDSILNNNDDKAKPRAKAGAF